MAAKQIIRLPQVESMVGLRRSAIYVRIQNETFPKPFPLGGRAVGWLRENVEEWIDEQAGRSTKIAA